MNLAILCQEEPIFLGPFLIQVMALRPGQVRAVFIAGRRSGGEKKDSFRNRWESMRIYWKIFEPKAFFESLLLKARSFLPFAPRCVARSARTLGIPVYRVGNPNGQDFIRLLKETQVDVVLNQSERLLKAEVLAVPLKGFVNRHASLLPAFRGRMAGFWSHAAEPPRYGLTIHRVDEGVDTGPILLQKEFRDVDPGWPYPRVMNHIMKEAPRLFWQAMDQWSEPGFVPRPHVPQEKPFKFPTLNDACVYSGLMAKRRGRPPEASRLADSTTEDRA